MSHSAPFSTQTQVHSMEALLRQRQQAFAKDQCILSGVSLFGQIMIGTAFYLYGHVSTPGYLSILLLFPLLLLIAFSSIWLARRAENGVILAAAGKIPGKALALLLFFVFLLDAQMAAYAICAILSDALPHFSPLLTMLAVALIMAAAIGGEDEYALPRLSRLMRWPIGLALGFCALSAFSNGSTGHLFPLLGHGADILGKGALWMSGCIAGACCPLLIPRAAQPLSPLEEKGSRLYRSLIWALAAGAVYALVSAYLLPVYALARPENLGFRLLLFTKISGSSPAWSLQLFSQLFVLLIALAAGVLRSACLVSWMADKKKPSPFLTTALLLLLVPAAALKSQPIEEGLIFFAPFRAAAVLLALVCLAIISLIRGKKTGNEKGEKP